MPTRPNPSVQVTLTRAQLEALDAVISGYNVDPCRMKHLHLSRELCDGWAPVEIRALDRASAKLSRAGQEADRIAMACTVCGRVEPGHDRALTYEEQPHEFTRYQQ